MLSGHVKFRDRCGERRHQITLEIAGSGQSIEQGLLRKPVHLDDPIDRIARATER